MRSSFANKMNSTPFRLLVGITRMIAIYFGIRSIDQLTGGIFAYHLQSSMQKALAPEMTDILPSVFAVYVPAFLLYVALMVAVWFAAPFICRLAVKGELVEGADHSDAIVWSPVMIFLVGTFLVGWGITRIAEDLTPYLQAKAKHIDYSLNLGTQIHIVISVILMGFGVIYMSRFASIFEWIDNRVKISGEQAAPSNGG
jgi:hypothetical protein